MEREKLPSKKTEEDTVVPLFAPTPAETGESERRDAFRMRTSDWCNQFEKLLTKEKDMQKLTVEKFAQAEQELVHGLRTVTANQLEACNDINRGMLKLWNLVEMNNTTNAATQKKLQARLTANIALTDALISGDWKPLSAEEAAEAEAEAAKLAADIAELMELKAKADAKLAV
jgi:hypothetical protein